MKKRSLIIATLIIFLNIVFMTNTKAAVLNETQFRDLGITKSYVVGKYVFDISKVDPTLWDFLRAIAFSDVDASMGDVKIIFVDFSDNEDGEPDQKYISLETNERLDSFPTLDVRYIYRSHINPSNPSSEDKDIIRDILPAPTLSNPMGGAENGVLNASLSINTAGAYNNNTSGITGFDLYEKEGNSYTFLKTVTGFTTEVTINKNQTRTFVAKAFYIDIDSFKVLSDYSEELSVEYYSPAEPVLSNVTIEEFNSNNEGTFIPILSEGKYTYSLGINSAAYQLNNRVTGYIVYEKDGNNYTEVGSTTMNGTITVNITPGESKTYVACVYYDEPNEEYAISDYSNELVIDHSTLTAPVLNNVTVDDYNSNHEDTFIPTLTEGTYSYDLGINASAFTRTVNQEVVSNIAGYKLYEKDGDVYTEVGTATVEGTVTVDVEPGEVKKYVAKVYAGSLYSDYSAEITINHTNYSITYFAGSGVIENNNPDRYTYGVGLDHFNNPTRSGGYTFDGWFVDENYETAINSILPTDSGNKILYAKWILFGDVNTDGVINSSDRDLLANYFNEVEGATISREGIDNSDVNNDGVIDDIDLLVLDKFIAGDINSLPYETGTKYSITYSLNGGSTGNNYLYDSYTTELLPISLPNPTKEGYVFEGWTGISNEAQINYSIPAGTTGNLALEASWYQLTKPTVSASVAGDTSTGTEYEIYIDLFEKDEQTGTVTYAKTAGQGLELWLSDDGVNFVKDQTVSYSVLGETEKGCLLLEALTDHRKYVKIRTYNYLGTDVTYSEFSEIVRLDGPKTIILGDINYDLAVNQLDLVYLEDYLMGEDLEIDILESDLNNDNEIDGVDLSILSKYLDGTINELPYNSGNKYTITYNLNGGTVDGYNTTRYAQISLPYRLNNPTKDGYVFIGWTGSNGVDPQEEITIAAGFTGSLSFSANFALYGDIDQSGVVDDTDLAMLDNYIDGGIVLNSVQTKQADLNLDGTIDAIDHSVLLYYINEKYDSLPLPGTYYKVDVEDKGVIIDTFWVLENHKFCNFMGDNSDIHFIGWYEEGSEDPYDFDTLITGNIKIVARYSE